MIDLRDPRLRRDHLRQQFGVRMVTRRRGKRMVWWHYTPDDALYPYQRDIVRMIEAVANGARIMWRLR